MQKIDYPTYKKQSNVWTVPEGDSVIRVVSSGAKALMHQIKTSRGFLVDQGECTNNIKCPFCSKGAKPANEIFFWIVLLKETGEIKLLKTSPNLGDKLATLGHDEGELQEYDVVINRRGLEKDNTVYTVRKAKEQTPLTPEELKSVELRKPFLINRYLTK